MMESRDDTERRCASCGHDLSAVRPVKKDELVGTVIADKFRLNARIGVGAMGAIYKAEQLSLGKTVGIKLLHRHLLADNTLSKRFHREARAAARLSHPNAITILDFGQTDDGVLYIAMEFIDGMDLAQLLFTQHPLEPQRIVHIMKQVCSALDEAHSKGIIHRDLKPENIMVTDTLREKDFVKVLDFGIAKLQDRAEGGRDSFQTMAGIVCGTPEYMSPEQARGEELDPRTDLYALGVLLYQLVTNKLPFTGDSPIAVVTRHLTEKPKSPREVNKNVPEVLDRLIMRLMSKQRDRRPPTALALVKELEAVEMALNMTGDTVQSSRALFDQAVPAAPPDKPAPPREPEEPTRESQDDGRSSQALAASETRLRKSGGTAIPRPPVTARRVARNSGSAPRRYTPTHIETRPLTGLHHQETSGPSPVTPDDYGSDADKTVVVPGMSQSVLEHVMKEAAERQRLAEEKRSSERGADVLSTAKPRGPAEEITARTLLEGPQTAEMNASGGEEDMHAQRTLAMPAPRPRRPLPPRKLESPMKRRPSQPWVVYLLAIAAVLGVGGFLLVRYLL